MGTINKHLQHVRSAEYKAGSDNKQPKLPTKDDLLYGEFALNYAKGVETISIKNNQDEIVTFPNNGDITNITSAITKISGDSITSITSNDKSITIVTGTNTTDLSAQKPIISDNYDSVVYPEWSGTTYPKGTTPVAAKDDLDTVAKKLDTTISGLTQEVIDDVEELICDLFILTSAATRMNESIGLNEHIKYVPQAPSISGFTNLSEAVDDLATKVTDSSNKVNRSGDTMTGGLQITSGGLAVSGNTTVNGTITSTGSIYSSDRKLKENISEINSSDIQKVSQVQLKEYNFISDNTQTKKYGVIAQELEESGLNNLVYETQDGTKGVDYISFLILKIQQLEQKNNELDRQIQELKK